MGAHSAKATRTAVAAGKAVVKNETLKEILASSPQTPGEFCSCCACCRCVIGFAVPIAAATEVVVPSTASLTSEDLHQKDPSLVVSVNQLSEAVEFKDPPGTNWSAKNFHLFKEMQRVRRSTC